MLRLAPALAQLGQVTPLVAPVEITSVGWGPFQRVCTEQGTLRGGAPRTERRVCLRAQATQDSGGWRVRVTPDTQGTAAPPIFTMLRGSDGRVSEVTAEPPSGSAPLSAEQRAGLLATARATLESLGVTRQRLAPREIFLLPLPDLSMQPGPLRGSRGLNCVPEIRAMLAGRPVVVARCLARLEGNLGVNATAQVVIAGNFALDVETGLLLAQAYATRIETFDTTGGRPPRSNGVLITTTRTRIE